MITQSDIKTDLRDLIYLQEESYNLVKSTDLPAKEKKVILDNLEEKQIIITKLFRFFNTAS